MDKYISVPTFSEGYRIANLNCKDIPIAVATGAFNHDFYTYYCYYYCFEKNWGHSAGDWLADKNNSLQFLGLTMINETVSLQTDLIEKLQACINRNCPVLLPVTYNSLFYCAGYKQPTHTSSHFIIVDGFNAEQKTMLIRDVVHVNDSEAYIIASGDGMYRLRITEQMLWDIWLLSNHQFEKNNTTHFMGKFFYLEKTGDSLTENHSDLLDHFITCFKPSHSSLVFFLQNSYPSIEHKDEFQMETIRRNFYGTLTILFDVIGSCAQDASEQLKEDIAQFQKKYLTFKSLLLAQVHASILRGKRLSNIAIEKMITETLAIDEELYELIVRFKQQE